MATHKQVFEALPHVDEVWITEDGHHHLHSHNGGKKFVRGEQKLKEAIEQQAPIETKISSKGAKK